MGGIKGQLVKEVYENYKKSGIADVSMGLNPEGRHESLNETNREEVYNIFFKWLKDHIPLK